MNKRIAAQRRYLREENAKHSSEMMPVPQPWPNLKGVTVEGVFRSSNYLAQLVRERASQSLRLTVSRTMIDETGKWIEGISWEALMQVKRECGLGDALAVEVYPRDKDIVNVANMRHLFILPDDYQVGWFVRKAVTA